MRQLDSHGWCCHVIALVNALVYYEAPVIPCQGWHWMQLQAITGCRYCSPPVEKIMEAAAYLELVLEEVPTTFPGVAYNIPVMLTLETKNEGVVHAVLVIASTDDGLEMANYKGKYGDSPVDVRPWDKLHPVQAWKVRRADRTGIV